MVIVMRQTNKEKIKGAIYGQIIGDALGVPVERKTRYDLLLDPIDGMTGGENTSHKLPPGRWSDDGSLTLATVDSLLKNNSLNTSDLIDRFVGWYHRGHYTPDGKSFGSGGTTRNAIAHFIKHRDPKTCGGDKPWNNGNGSLMRILPLTFYMNKFDPAFEDRYRIVKSASALTHANKISVLACTYLVSFAQILADNFNKYEAYNQLRLHFISEMADNSNLDLLDDTNTAYRQVDLSWIDPFKRLLYGNIYDLPEDAIDSGFYVIETLEAAIWCIMTTDSFESAVLTAVNMGGDSDSTAAVVGGLAGLIYGFEAIPQQWVDELPRQKYLYDIIEEFADRFEMDIEDWYTDEEDEIPDEDDDDSITP